MIIIDSAFTFLLLRTNPDIHALFSLKCHDLQNCIATTKMIDLQLYRVRIGCFNPVKHANSIFNKNLKGRVWGAKYGGDAREGNVLLYYWLYVFFMFILITTCFVIMHFNPHQFTTHHSLVLMHHTIFSRSCDLPYSSILHIKLLYILLLFHIYKVLVKDMYYRLCRRYRVSNLSTANLFFGMNTSKLKKLFAYLMLALL